MFRSSLSKATEATKEEYMFLLPQKQIQNVQYGHILTVKKRSEISELFLDETGIAPGAEMAQGFLQKCPCTNAL